MSWSKSAKRTVSALRYDNEQPHVPTKKHPLVVPKPEMGLVELQNLFTATVTPEFMNGWIGLLEAEFTELMADNQGSSQFSIRVSEIPSVIAADIVLNGLIDDKHQLQLTEWLRVSEAGELVAEVMFERGWGLATDERGEKVIAASKAPR